MAYDLSPYKSYLDYASPSFAENIGQENDAMPTYKAPDWNNGGLEQLFNFNYSGRGANLNPYGSIGARDQVRDISTKAGWGQDEADQAALRYAQGHYSGVGQPYDLASSPNIIEEYILRDLAGKHGVNYSGASPDQMQQWDSEAWGREQHKQDMDSNDWGQEPGLNIIATRLNSMGNNLDEWKKHPDQFLSGANSGSQVNFSNKYLGTDYKQNADWKGDPDSTEDNQRDAAGQGYDPTGSSMWKTIASWLAAGQMGAARGGEAAAVDGADASMGSNGLSDYSGGNGAWGTDSGNYGDFTDLSKMLLKQLPQLQQVLGGSAGRGGMTAGGGQTPAASNGSTGMSSLGSSYPGGNNSQFNMGGDDDKPINQGWTLQDVWNRMRV